MELINVFNEFLSLDWTEFFSAIIVLLALITAVLASIDRISKAIGKPIKLFQRGNKDHELLEKTSENLIALQEDCERSKQASIKNDKTIHEDIENLTSMFVDKEIDDYRWCIINLANEISAGKVCSKDSFTHCFKVYNKYEKVLEEYHMENHEVDVSMDIIKEAFKENYGADK